MCDSKNIWLLRTLKNIWNNIFNFSNGTKIHQKNPTLKGLMCMQIFFSRSALFLTGEHVDDHCGWLTPWAIIFFDGFPRIFLETKLGGGKGEKLGLMKIGVSIPQKIFPIFQSNGWWVYCYYNCRIALTFLLFGEKWITCWRFHGNSSFEDSQCWLSILHWLAGSRRRMYNSMGFDGAATVAGKKSGV